MCNICGNVDTDAHLFKCPGFVDLLKDVTYKVFFDDSVEVDVVSVAAERMIMVNERLMTIQDNMNEQ